MHRFVILRNIRARSDMVHSRPNYRILHLQACEGQPEICQSPFNVHKEGISVSCMIFIGVGGPPKK